MILPIIGRGSQDQINAARMLTSINPQLEGTNDDHTHSFKKYQIAHGGRDGWGTVDGFSQDAERVLARIDDYDDVVSSARGQPPAVSTLSTGAGR